MEVNSASAEVVRNVFLDALEIPPGAERDERLRMSCANNSDVYRTVSKMLADYSALGDFMPGAAFDSTPLEASRAPRDLAGQRLGPYNLVRKIGEGGCGVVYLAEQDKPVRRRVAIKVIKPGMDSASVIARFGAERQALAMMDHPCIARVFDPGETGEGRPYFVMEFVEGQRVTEYCANHDLSTRKRLELFVQICQAVQHAHQKGVIHRDIKPSNILVAMVDGLPLPKIIDFGIAKAVSGRLTDQTIHTSLAHFIGTPAYMSPEQALITSEDIDTRTDIYSLGVLLYELLTGRTPFDNQQLITAGLDEMRQTIREVEPKRPSQVGSTPVDADLDWIVMKCLEKDRSRRYETAIGLAADIQRYLRQEPVVARPATATYRLGRFVRRYRWQVAASAALLLTMFAGTALSTWQAHRAKTAERHAHVAVDFLVDQIAMSNLGMIENPNPVNRLLLERTAAGLDGKFEGQPLAEAKLRIGLGLALWHYEHTHFKRAYELRRPVLGLAHTDTIEALCLLAASHIYAERFPEAEALLQEAERVVPAATESLARAYSDQAWGRFHRHQERYKESIPFYERALAGFQKFAPGVQNLRATEMELVFVYFHAGQPAEAERRMDEYIARYVREAPNNLSSLGAQKLKAYFFLLNRGEAEAKEALAIFERITPKTVEILGTNSAGSLDMEWCLGQAYQRCGYTNDAIRTYAALTPRWPRVAPWGMNKCAEIAEWFVQVGELDEASAAYKALIECFSKSPPKSDYDLVLLARATAATDGWEAAAKLLRSSTNSSDSLMFCLQSAWVYQFVGDQKGHLQMVRQAVRLAPNITNQHHLHLPLEVAGLAPVELSEEEKRELTKLISRLRAAFPQLQPPQTVWARRALGLYLFRQGAPEAALQELELAGSDATGDDAYTCFLKAACLYKLNKTDQALLQYSKAEAAMQTRLPSLLRLERFLQPGLYQELIIRREVNELLRPR